MAKAKNNTHSQSPLRKLPELLTTDEVIRLLRIESHVSPANTLYKLRQRGVLKGVRFGISFKYPAGQFHEMLAGM